MGRKQSLSLAHLIIALCGVISTNLSLAFAVEKTIPITFAGGHETDPRDNGRPVVLIAAALGVKPEIFREAFSNVRPAKNGKPTGDEARRNKEVLLKALRPYGITNERLDEVSDYYRYQPEEGGLWRTRPAKAHAVVENDKVKSIVVDEPGSGYTSPPVPTLSSMEKTRLKVKLQFSKDLPRNGAIKAIEVDSSEAAR
jgi:hypothetical protein